MTRSLLLFRRWWPIPALLVFGLVVQKVLFESRYHVSGHAAEHLGSSTAIFFAVPILLILVWVLASARSRPFFLGGAIVWIGGLVGVLVGNVRVVDAIGTANWTFEEADTFGASRLGYDSGHDLAQVSSFVALAGALLLIAAVWRAGVVSGRVAIVCAMVSVLIPPWIFPGAGAVLLTFWIAKQRQKLSAAATEPDSARRSAL